MKSPALMLLTALCLSACVTAPRKEPLVACPTLPTLESAAPERDWLGQMDGFLQGTLPTPPASKPPTGNAGQGIKLPSNGSTLWRSEAP